MSIDDDTSAENNTYGTRHHRRQMSPMQRHQPAWESRSQHGNQGIDLTELDATPSPDYLVKRTRSIGEDGW